MDPEILKYDPTRPPQWRLDRVMEMIGHRPSPLLPRRYDDHHTRAYRRFLLDFIAAGDNQKLRDEVVQYLPHVYHAHRLHFTPDIEPRQILEARLLTGESDEEIGRRFDLAPQVIDYFEKLFFNVRDRLQCRAWIQKAAIWGAPGARTANKNGIMTDDQRGVIYRLFAYHGGPLALDALTSGLGSTTALKSAVDADAWFNDNFRQVVVSKAATAASVLDVTNQNCMRLIKLALKEIAKSAKLRR